MASSVAEAELKNQPLWATPTETQSLDPEGATVAEAQKEGSALHA